MLLAQIDTFHKLFLTSVLAFFPYVAQLPVGMAVVTMYHMSLLYVNPYLRVGDDSLHSLSLVEIFLLMCVGYVFNSLVRFA